MKQLFKKSLLMLVGISMFAGTIMAAAVPANTPSNPLTEEKPAPNVKEMMKSFNGLTRSEKKTRIKAVKKELKDFKKMKKAGKEPKASEVVLVILAILLPPLAVYLHQGEINNKFWISLLLTLLLWLPGIIYALLVIFGEV